MFLGLCVFIESVRPFAIDHLKIHDIVGFKYAPKSLRGFVLKDEK